MDALIAAFLAGLGTLLGVAAAMRVAGRRRLDAPRCAACGVDVRDRAWPDDAAASPTCSCGAALNRAGAIRTMREPAPRWVRRTLTTLAILAGLLLGADLALRASGVRWLQLAPTMWLPTVASIDNDAARSEALVELDRRVRADEVSAEEAVRLLAIDLDRTFAPRGFADTYGLTLDLARIAHQDRDGMRAYLEGALTVDARLGAALPAAGTIDCTLTLGGSSRFGLKVVRVERVLVDGMECPWTLAPVPATATLSMVGPRAFTGTAILRVTPPAAGGAELRVECTIALIGHVESIIDVEDSLINDPALPASEWRVNAIPVTRTIALPLGGTTPTGAAR